jgi:hypothetical protein
MQAGNGSFPCSLPTLTLQHALLVCSSSCQIRHDEDTQRYAATEHNGMMMEGDDATAMVARPAA